MDLPTPAANPAVTVVISRRVKPGYETEFEAFLEGVIGACGQFPGYLGSNIFRPANADDPEYRVIFKFSRLSHLRRWESSQERQFWFAQAEALTLHPPEIQVITGLETWFTLPGKPNLPPPPRYKMAIVTWLAVFPLITLISATLKQPLAELPLVLRVMVITAIAVPTMTYGLMPHMTRLFAPWLYPTDLPEFSTASNPPSSQLLSPSSSDPLTELEVPAAVSIPEVNAGI